MRFIHRSVSSSFTKLILLVFALADSHTGEVAKQYQIVSLIVVRRGFKDIGSFESFEHWLTETEAVKAVLTDMGGAVLMFVLVTVFTLLRRTVPKVAIQRDLIGFIELKKAVAVLFAGRAFRPGPTEPCSLATCVASIPTGTDTIARC